MKKLWLIGLILCLCLAAAACTGDNTATEEPAPAADPTTLPEGHTPEAIAARGELIVAVPAEECWASFLVPADAETYGELAGEYSGVAISLARQIAADMGVGVTFTTYDTLDATLQAVASGEADMAASNFSRSEQRMQTYAVSDNYAVWELAEGDSIWLRMDTVTGETAIADGEALRTAKIAVVAGSAQAEQTAKAYPQATLAEYADNEACLQALTTAEADAAVFASPSAEFGELCNAQVDAGLITWTEWMVPDDTDGLGLIMMKGNEALAAEVNTAIATYSAGGQLEQWFNEGVDLATDIFAD